MNITVTVIDTDDDGYWHVKEEDGTEWWFGGPEADEYQPLPPYDTTDFIEAGAKIKVDVRDLTYYQSPDEYPPEKQRQYADWQKEEVS